MKHLNALCVTAIIAAMFILQTGSASATVLTSPSGTEYTKSLTLTAVTTQLISAGFANITCTESTLSGSVSANSITANGSFGTVSFSNCGFSTVDVLSNGGFEISSGGNVQVEKLQITVSVAGTSCVYGSLFSKTSLGLLQGGTPAKFHVTGSLPKASGGFACSNPASWTGFYQVTTPSTLLVD